MADKEKERGGPMGFLVLLLIGVPAYLGYLYFFNPVKWYALVDGVDEKNVYLQDKPHDCNWDAAPIGNKYCHYEKEVSVVKNESGRTTSVEVSWYRVEE